MKNTMMPIMTKLQQNMSSEEPADPSSMPTIDEVD